MSAKAFAIRPARAADVPAICAIYRREVLERAATFELTPPDEAEMLARMRGIQDGGFPYLAAEMRTGGTGEEGGTMGGTGGTGEFAGYAYAAPFRSRPAYRFAVEDSIYIAPAFQRRGIGLALLTALMTECERLGFRQMTAVISDPENCGSVRFHERAGFRQAGVLENIGWKFDRWIDAVLMTKALGPGASSPPEEIRRTDC